MQKFKVVFSSQSGSLILILIFAFLLTIPLTGLPRTQPDKNENHFFNLGILTGISQHHIHFDDEYSSPDLTSKNRNLYFGIFTQFIFKKITIEAGVDYKNRAFLAQNFDWDLYGYVLDLQMRYLNTSLKFGTLFDIQGIKTNLYAGIGNGYIVSGQRKYVTVISLTARAGDVSTYKDDPHLQKRLDRNSYVYTIGAAFEPNIFNKRIDFGIDADFLQPTNDYAKKEFEGGGVPLSRPFQFYSVSLYLKFRLFRI